MWFAEQADAIRRLSPEGFAFVLALMAVGTALAFYAIWRNLHRARMVEDMPTARIRSAHQGYVELEGAGRPLGGTPILAPLSGTPCLWYRFRVEHRESSRTSGGQDGSHWSTVRSGRSHGPFLLDDGTGRCIVDPDGAEVIPGVCDVWYGDAELPRRGPPRRASWFRWGTGDYRYTEERLMPGPLYALGWFTTAGDGAEAARTETAALLRRWKGDRPALLARFDRDGNGRIAADEWEAARAAALQAVLASGRPRASVDSVLGRSPSDRQPFLLAAQSQHALAARYRRRSLTSLVLACAGITAVLWSALARWGT